MKLLRALKCYACYKITDSDFAEKVKEHRYRNSFFSSMDFSTDMISDFCVRVVSQLAPEKLGCQLVGKISIVLSGVGELRMSSTLFGAEISRKISHGISCGNYWVTQLNCRSPSPYDVYFFPLGIFVFTPNIGSERLRWRRFCRLVSTLSCRYQVGVQHMSKKLSLFIKFRSGIIN